MDTFFSALSGILGKPESDPALLRLLDILGEPSNVYEVGEQRTYQFKNWGIGLRCQKQRFFWGLILEFGTKGVRDGLVKPYMQDLPQGIERTDQRAQIKKKLGLEPHFMQSGVPRDLAGDCCGIGAVQIEKYKVNEHDYTFIFDSEADQLLLLAINCFIGNSHLTSHTASD